MAKVAAKKVIKNRRDRKNIEKGHAHIRSTFNNTIVTITDVMGNTVSWASSGGMGFKGSRRTRRSLHRPLPKLPQRELWNMV